ncbi:peptidyl-tRNA hydrolase domain containing protein [Grosmannia clavigera kw1407]|uniref:Peptidyl-tRNA hydrolase domain containing protein n=1 Tax=Grosmannia clavigera (strain kw1407 / UAMH 11150) TaxID=655863 RepID=F0XRF3_GROCL|nr:peptidyl-tRNA hydrolase domain containing protein [Grosmannia clavigera kw1407]EFW99807.1 peptidyl-tRNA hydrolase domain containing protein [Grosmannia clavigera kw1407]
MRLTIARQLQVLIRRPAPAWTWPFSSAAAAPFVTSACRAIKPMPPRPPPPPEDEIEEMFVKGTGPGGQKINKTNSAVQLIHRPTGIVVKSQATRSRSQNRTIARQVLAARLDELHNGSQSRTAIVADSKRRKKASASKKSRRKYRHTNA